MPTPFSGTLLSLILPAVRAAAIAQLHVNPNNTDLTLRNIDVFKTGSDLFVKDFVPAQAQHLSVGVQRQVTSDFAVTADFAFRHYIHEKLRGIDLNHYNSISGPVIPACPPALATVPGRGLFQRPDSGHHQRRQRHLQGPAGARRQALQPPPLGQASPTRCRATRTSTDSIS